MIKVDTAIFSRFGVANLWEKGISSLNQIIHSPWTKWSAGAGVCLAAFAIARLRTHLIPYDKKLELLASNPDVDQVFELYQELIPVRGHWFYSKRWEALKTYLASRNDIAAQFCAKLIERQIKEPQKDWISPASELITIEQLCKLENIDAAALRKHADNLAKALEKLPEEPATVRGFLGGYTAPVIGYLSQALQSFSSTFLRAHDFSSDDNNSLIQRPEAMYRLQSFYEVIEKPAILLLALFSYLQSKTSHRWIPYAGILCSIMVAMGAIKFFHTSHKKEEPILSHDFRNLSEDAKKGILPLALNCSENIAKIAECFIPLDKNSLSVLLIGPPGAGKDALVNGFVWAIQNGDFPSLHKVQVHTSTTSELKEFGGGTGHVYLSRLQILLRDLRGKEHQNIIFFNEIHTLNPKKGQPSSDHTDLGQQFKRNVETGRLHVIGATTLKEYRDHILPDEPLDRRFVKIFVGATSSNDKYAEILEATLAEEYPTVPFETEAIKLALAETDKILPAISQPSKAKQLLARAARSVIANYGEQEKILVDLSEKLAQERRVLKRDLTNVEKAESVAQLVGKADDQKKKLADKWKDLDSLNELKQIQLRYQQQLNRLAHRISLLPEKSTAGMEKFFMARRLIKTLEIAIREKEIALRKNGLRIKVDKDLIKEMVVKDKADTDSIHSMLNSKTEN